MVCFTLLMTQQIPQTVAGDVLVLEISINPSPDSAQVGSAVCAEPSSCVYYSIISTKHN